MTTRVADVVFDAPVDQAFSYRVPPELTVGAGQRVAAVLGGAERVGLVVGVREEPAGNARLKPILRALDPVPCDRIWSVGHRRRRPLAGINRLHLVDLAVVRLALVLGQPGPDDGVHR